MDTQSLKHFQRDGYGIARGLSPEPLRSHMLEIARAHLARAVAPLEYEADVRYPGAPASQDAPGGRTVRRLLQAYVRDPAFAAWATAPELAQAAKVDEKTTMTRSRAIAA